MVTVTTAIVAKLVAADGQEDAVAAFLTDALPLAEAEPATTVWFALRTDASTFWIVDAFPDADGRQAHLDGEIDRRCSPTRASCWPRARRSCPPTSWPPKL